jgi:protein TonB
MLNNRSQRHIKAVVVLIHIGLIWAIVQSTSTRLTPKAIIEPVTAFFIADVVQSDAIIKPTLETVKPLTAQSQLQATALDNSSYKVESISAANLKPDSSIVINTSSQLPNINPSKPNIERLQTIELPSSDADYLHNPPPIYPRMSKRLGEQGTVILKVLIGVNGQAEKIEIFKSSGFDRLDQAAIETAAKWRYKPGQRMGQAEAMWFNLPIRFELN